MFRFIRSPRQTRPTEGQPARRLKKQPKLRQVNQATAIPSRLVIPEEANQAARRRRYQQQRIQWQWPAELAKTVLTSSRWISLLVLGVTLYAFNIVGSSTQFYLTSLPVEGVYAVPPEEVVFASGLAGQHIFSIDPTQAAEGITNQVPGILAAEVVLQWPNQVTIKVTEDKPIAVWEQAGESFWVNEVGQLMPARLDIPNLPRIKTNSTISTVGMVLASEETAAEEVIAIASNDQTQKYEALGALPRNILDGAFQLFELFPEQKSLTYDAEHGFIYEDSRGWVGYFGTGTDMEQKLVVYETIAQELKAQGLQPEYISVSNQEKPFYMAQESE